MNKNKEWEERFYDKWEKAPDYHDPNTHANYPAENIELMCDKGYLIKLSEVKDFIREVVSQAEDSMRKRCLEGAEKRYRYTIETLEAQNKLLLERLQLKHLSEPMVFQVSDLSTQNINNLDKGE